MGSAGALRSVLGRRIGATVVALAVIGLGTGLPSRSTAAAASPLLHVIPFPGTPDAAPASQIIFSSLTPSQLTDVVVSGSASGVHSGHLEALPDGAGTAFVPDQPFAAGEQVSVQAVLSSPAAGTASGDPGATTLSFSFTIAQPTSGARSPEQPSPQTVPTQHFPSEPALHPVAVHVTPDQAQGSGDMFVAPRSFRVVPGANYQQGPMILNSRGQLVWFDPVSRMASNLEVQQYRGQPVLTWWQAPNQDVMMNQAYQTLKVLQAGYGYVADAHEFQITPQGTALIEAYPAVQANLSGLGGASDGKLLDCVIQELDIKTGRVVWEWHALGHIPLSASHEPIPSAPAVWDPFHLNSIQQLPNGNLLISMRHTWAVYEISHRTGQVIWALGGKDSSFKMTHGTTFEWQHDAHLYSDGVVSLFNDAAPPQEQRQSSAMALRLNFKARLVTLVRRYTHAPPLLADFGGSLQLLPNGHAVVGWGSASQFSEYDSAGQQVFNGSLPLEIYSYRAYSFAWTGDPLTRPAIAVLAKGSGRPTVYASWNGATRVASWRVLGGVSSNQLRPVQTMPSTGFETATGLDGTPRYVAVQALNSWGNVLATSSPRSVPAG